MLRFASAYRLWSSRGVTTTATAKATAALRAPTRTLAEAAAAPEMAAPEVAGPEGYNAAHQAMHWLMAGAAVTCFATVNIAQQSKDKKTKGDMMFLHKSAGTLAGILLAPRIAVRLMSKVPALPPGHALEHLAARVGHMGLYAGMTVMPLTGIAMGYYGGKGLPFFWTTIPGATKENKNGKLAGQAFKLHKRLGQPFEALFGLHLGAVGFHHIAKGQPILWGMLPFANCRIKAMAADTQNALSLDVPDDDLPGPPKLQPQKQQPKSDLWDCSPSCCCCQSLPRAARIALWLLLAAVIVVIVVLVGVGSAWYIKAYKPVGFIVVADALCDSENCDSADHSSWAEVLATSTIPDQKSPEGVSYTAVDYANVNRPALEEYVNYLAAVNVSSLRSEEALALYINAYNALALKKVLDSYTEDLESIRDLGTFLDPVWRSRAGVVGGKAVTLDDLEHGIIRANWPDEPRIHAAVNCASVSCPDLAGEPYEGSTLDEQLNKATFLWLAQDGKGVNTNPATGDVALSMLFTWYGGDFAKHTPDGDVITWISEALTNGTNAAYLDATVRSNLAAKRDFLIANASSVSSLPYDWSLNKPAA